MVTHIVVYVLRSGGGGYIGGGDTFSREDTTKAS